MKAATRTTALIGCLLGAALLAPAAAGAADPELDAFQEVLPQGSPLAAGAASSRSSGAEAKISGRGPKRLTLGFADPAYRNEGLQSALLNETVAVNGSVVQVWMDWRGVAPSSPSPGFNAADPASPQYKFAAYDALIREAVQRGLRPVILIYRAPDWAEGKNRGKRAPAGTWKPNPSDFAEFAGAVARRYSGNFLGLPRVQDYVAWNEPNLSSQLNPVWRGKPGEKGGRIPAAAEHYVRMLNAFYQAVKGVNGSNKVVAGATAPYGAPPAYFNKRIRPLLFWRHMFCMKGAGSRELRKAKRCGPKPKFDVAAHHPINTSGGPRGSAIHPDDVSTGDLKHLVKVLRWAERHKRVSPGKRPVWANEIWWESNPPDPADGNPNPRKQAEWYAEAFYVLWKQGASMVLPFQVRDESYRGGHPLSNYQTGVYFVDGRPKPAAKAMRFPFVADRENKTRVALWGIAPESGKVKIEERRRKGFKKVTKIKVRAGTVFYKKIRLRGKQKLRATMIGGGGSSMLWKVR